MHTKDLEIKVKVKKLTKEKLAEDILNSLLLHVRVKLKHGEEGILRIGKVEFPVKISKPGWS
ncbi:MAG: hypothetical protein QXZ66_07330 [Thermoproteota archaeon]